MDNISTLSWISTNWPCGFQWSKLLLPTMEVNSLTLVYKTIYIFNQFIYNAMQVMKILLRYSDLPCPIDKRLL